MSNYNRIYLGGAHRNTPETINYRANVALIPGTLAMILMVSGEPKLIVHDGSTDADFVVDKKYFSPLTEGYAIDETVFANIPASQDQYQLRLLPASAVNEGDPLTVGAGGFVGPAAAEDRVLYYATETITAAAAPAVTYISVRRP